MALPGISSVIHVLLLEFSGLPLELVRGPLGTQTLGPGALVDKKLGWWRVETEKSND